MTAMRALMAVLLVGSTLGLAACDETEGPAEQVGEAIDEGAQDAKRAVDDATD